MEHESFEDAATAALMNEHFVSVKVDREERPDLDAVYMEAVVALTGHGGWPMTVFLTPAGEPFFGGTYYPPEPRHGLPSFRQVLEAVAEAWRERREDVATSAAQLVEAVRHSSSLQPSKEPLTDGLLSAAARGLRTQFDPREGGWGRAPKFPNAPVLEFLLRRGDEDSLAMVTRTLDAMSAGGMYDLLGGGFHRYSVDNRWLVPHFEKMLYDNALLAPAYLHGWLVTGDERYREICPRDDRVHAPRAAAAGRRVRLGAGRGHRRRRGADVHVDGGGGRARGAARAVRARALDHPRRARPRRCARGSSSSARRGRSRCATTRRSRPGTGSRWPRSRRRGGGSTSRTGSPRPTGSGPSCSGRFRRTGGCCAATATGGRAEPAISTTTRTSPTACSSCTSRPASCAGSRRRSRLARLAVELFGDDERGGFFLVDRYRDPLIAKTKELDDHPLPSGNSMLAHVLLRLARIYGDDELERQAVSVLRLVRPALERAPSAFGWALCALELHLSTPRELAIVGPVDSPVARAALAPWQPETVVAVGPADGVPLLAGKGLVDGRPAVYVCERFACRAPVTDPAELTIS